MVIKREDLFKLINVQDPYFALEDVSVEDNNITTARLKIEQPIGSEVYPISSGEASRHMVVMGSVSSAMANPVKRKHYYLPQRGSFKRINPDKSFHATNELFARSVCKSIEKRTTCVETLLTDINGNDIAKAEIYYNVIPDTTFERLYKSFYKEKPSFRIENPFKIKNELYSVTVTDKSASASLGKVPDYYCVGHFHNVPAMPVAILLNNFFDLASLYIHNNTKDNSLKLLVKEFVLSAENLVFAGDEASLSTTLNYVKGNTFALDCVALANGSKNIANVKMVIEAVKR